MVNRMRGPRDRNDGGDFKQDVERLFEFDRDEDNKEEESEEEED